MDIHVCVDTLFTQPKITTPNGRIVIRVSRECCPYLDDYEQNYSPAVPAAVQSEVNKEPRKPSLGTHEAHSTTSRNPTRKPRNDGRHPQRGGQPTTPTLRFLQLGGQVPTPTPTVRCTRKSGRPTTTPTLAQPPKNPNLDNGWKVQPQNQSS